MDLFNRLLRMTMRADDDISPCLKQDIDDLLLTRLQFMAPGRTGVQQDHAKISLSLGLANPAEQVAQIRTLPVMSLFRQSSYPGFPSFRNHIPGLYDIGYTEEGDLDAIVFLNFIAEGLGIGILSPTRPHRGNAGIFKPLHGLLDHFGAVKIIPMVGGAGCQRK